MSDVDQSGPTCRLSIAQQMYDVCGLLHNNIIVYRKIVHVEIRV